MSDLETRLRVLLQETRPDPTQPTALAEGARRYAVRARWVRIATTAAAAALAVALGLGGAVASGAFRDRTLPPVRPHPAPSTTRKLPPGPAWVQSVKFTTSTGTTFTFDVRAVVTTPGTSSPDPADRAKRLVTVPQMGGYYTLTNTSRAAYDLGEPVRLFAYWNVPSGFCLRFNPFMRATLTDNRIPLVRLPGGQELCPMAWGDSTLDGTPQTLRPRAPASLSIVTLPMALRQDYPFHLTKADADVMATVTATAPVGWFASDEQLSPNADHGIARKGIPAP